ncbi:MAG: hypothetical protein L0Y35_02875 [Flammeovirgaceae bacterium]|nr:hypothetical protein [Flammeovirgaceae bacterium]
MAKWQDGHYDFEKLKKRARSQAIVLTLFTLIAITSLVFSFLQKVNADRNAEEALRQREIAVRQEQLAVAAAQECEQFKIQLKNCKN